MNCDNCGEFIGLGKPRVDLLVPGEGNRCYHPECYNALYCTFAIPPLESIGIPAEDVQKRIDELELEQWAQTAKTIWALGDKGLEVKTRWNGHYWCCSIIIDGEWVAFWKKDFHQSVRAAGIAAYKALKGNQDGIL